MMAYLIIVADTLPPIFSAMGIDFLTTRDSVIVVFGLGVMLPLSLLKDMSSLAISSSISVLSDIIMTLIVLFSAKATVNSFDGTGQAFMRGNGIVTINVTAPEQNLPFASPRMFAGVGVMSFAFVCQHSSLIVFKSMKKQEFTPWRLVSLMSVGSSFVLCLIMALSGELDVKVST